MECLAQVFEEEHALDKLEAFVSINGPQFYGLPVNENLITLERIEPTLPTEVAVPALKETIQVFEPPVPLQWRVKAIQ